MADDPAKQLSAVMDRLDDRIKTEAENLREGEKYHPAFYDEFGFNDRKARFPGLLPGDPSDWSEWQIVFAAGELSGMRWARDLLEADDPRNGP